MQKEALGKELGGQPFAQISQNQPHPSNQPHQEEEPSRPGSNLQREQIHAAPKDL